MYVCCYREAKGKKQNYTPGRGARFILINAGSKDGYVQGAALVFNAKATTGDYHGEVNTDLFSVWWNEKLLPNLPQNSIIVIDNASYHNTTTEDSRIQSKKADLQKWLDKKVNMLMTDT